MATLLEQRAAALKAAQDIATAAKAEKREDLNADEVQKIKGHLEEVDALDLKIRAAKESAATLNRLGLIEPGKQAPASDDDKPAKSLGEHFIKHVGERLKEIRGVKGASASAPEFKAATDTQATGGPTGVFGPVLTQIDPTIVQAFRPRLVIADLLGSGTMSGQAITYFVEGAIEGAFTTVAEGAAKPQLHVANPTTVTDSLRKIAGFIKLTDEMTEDLAYVVSEINTRLLYELGRFEEAQLLSGDGTGTNLLGVLNRAGIQTEAAADVADNPDALFRAMTKVSTVTGLDADGIAINPTDYQAMRLSRDGNGQYYGGGYFQGEYGNGSILSQPPLWGMRTVVTPAVAVGTAVVAAWSQAATVYRKGGVRVESTNSHANDFTSNLVTVRAEERLALAVRVPAAFVKVTLGEPA
jgi:HK97 family phage major capsid protein